MAEMLVCNEARRFVVRTIKFLLSSLSALAQAPLRPETCDCIDALRPPPPPPSTFSSSMAPRLDRTDALLLTVAVVGEAPTPTPAPGPIAVPGGSSLLGLTVAVAVTVAVPASAAGGDASSPSSVPPSSLSCDRSDITEFLRARGRKCCGSDDERGAAAAAAEGTVIIFPLSPLARTCAFLSKLGCNNFI